MCSAITFLEGEACMIFWCLLPHNSHLIPISFLQRHAVLLLRRLLTFHPLLRHQCSIHYESSCVAHDASKWKWGPQTTLDTAKASISETENFQIKNKQAKFEKRSKV